MRDVRLFCAIAAWSIWIGGFTFYFGVVVPIGGAVVGGSSQGLVTQQATYWLNLIGIAAMGILLWNAISARSRLLIGTLSVMAICHAILLVMHYRLDAMIDVKAGQVIDTARFHVTHEAYEVVATIQWIAGIVHLFGIARCAGHSVPKPLSESPCDKFFSSGNTTIGPKDI